MCPAHQVLSKFELLLVHCGITDCQRHSFEFSFRFSYVLFLYIQIYILQSSEHLQKTLKEFG